MELDSERHENRLCLHAAGEMTIYSAAELKPTILAALEQSDEVDIDLSEVSEVDTSGVQLLMLMKREALAAGKGLTLSGHSPAVLEVFELLGLGSWFGDPQVLPAGVARRVA
ncbi:MAG: STAS domain-containing protein [Rhizobium sp.]|nr:STAS domain-containing protein [Rhizobium sp.]